MTDVNALDPDWDDVPAELRELAGKPSALVITDDGMSSDVVVVVPGLFGHARRLRTGFYGTDH